MSTIRFREYVKSFLIEYPQLVNRDQTFYHKKCFTVSLLFQNYIRNTYNIQSDVILGRNINRSYLDTWFDTPINEINDNVTANVSFGNVVVKVNNVIIDITSHQYQNELYAVYWYQEFRNRWNTILPNVKLIEPYNCIKIKDLHI
jgi:hypothetical protein